MNLKSFIDKISSLENNLNIDNVKTFDFNPWPYIRLSTLHKYNSKKRVIKNSKPVKKNKFKKIKNLIQSFVRYYQNPIKTEKVDIVYFTRLSESKEMVNNKYLNRYSDSFIELFGKDYRVKVLEVSDDEWSEKTYHNDNIIYIDWLLKIEQIKKSLFPFLVKKSKTLPTFVHKEIEDVFGFQVDVQSELESLNTMSMKFMKILRHYNPKLVFLTVFYCPNAMAMSLACHRLGIKVVEYQHGAQNDFHAMYTHWNNVPKQGYELIPDIFWMWGHIPKERIDKWTTNTAKHQAIVGGNLWLSFNKQRDVKILNLNEYYKKDMINILVSLQGDMFFSEFLLECIQNSPENIMWHFRDHPRLPLSENNKKRITDFKNTEFNFSTNTTLYELLKKTDIHITGYSTVAFEAQSFNIPTIFTHSNAKNGYNSLINSNGLFYVTNAKDLETMINRLSEEDQNIKANYIISDLKVHKTTLMTLMGTR